MLHSSRKGFSNIFYAAMLIEILMLLSKSFVKKTSLPGTEHASGKDVKDV